MLSSQVIFAVNICRDCTFSQICLQLSTISQARLKLFCAPFASCFCFVFFCSNSCLLKCPSLPQFLRFYRCAGFEMAAVVFGSLNTQWCVHSTGFVLEFSGTFITERNDKHSCSLLVHGHRCCFLDFLKSEPVRNAWVQFYRGFKRLLVTL